MGSPIPIPPCPNHAIGRACTCSYCLARNPYFGNPRHRALDDLQARVDRLRHFVEGVAKMAQACERGLTEADVRTPDHRRYLFAFHDEIIAQARAVLAMEESS